jgi:heme iron utilization protein
MTHVPRLTRELGALVQSRRVAALGTTNADGSPLVSMVPYAVEPRLGCFVIHVSGLAAHTANLLARAQVSLLVMQAEAPGEAVHALPRATFDGSARRLERDTEPWQACRAAYLARFPEAEPMTHFGDFRFILVEPTGARQVAGFGAARSIGADEVKLALGRAP